MYCSLTIILFCLVSVVSDVSGGAPGAESTRLDTSTVSHYNTSKEVRHIRFA